MSISVCICVAVCVFEGLGLAWLEEREPLLTLSSLSAIMCLFSVYLRVCVCLEHLAWLDEREREPLRASSPVCRAPPPIAATPSHCQR